MVIYVGTCYWLYNVLLDIPANKKKRPIQQVNKIKHAAHMSSHTCYMKASSIYILWLNIFHLMLQKYLLDQVEMIGKS